MSKQSSSALAKKRAATLYKRKKFAEAAASYSRICDKSPQDHEAWLFYGLCEKQLRNFDNAIRLLQFSDSLNPNSAKTQDYLGQTYLEKGWTDKAIEHSQKAIQLDETNERFHDTHIKSLLSAGKYLETIIACKDALSHFPESVEINCKIAVALEQTSQLEEAQIYTNKTLSLQPLHIRANYIAAKIDKRVGNLDDASDRLYGLLKNKLSPVQASTLSAELADTLDRKGEYEKAFQMYSKSNSHLTKTIPPEQKSHPSIFEHINRLHFWFTEKNVENWDKNNDKSDRVSPIFLVGFPRSGTTLTEQIVASLDNLVPSDEKPFLTRLMQDIPSLINRPFNYPNDLNNLTEDELQVLRNRYWELVENLLRPLNNNERLIDKLPLNIIDLGFIYRLFPDARIIVVIRDPRDCILSCFMQSFQLNQAMVNFLSLSQSARFYAATMKLYQHYRSIIKAPIIQVRYEDLIQNLESESKRLVDFIGETWDESVLNYHQNTSKRNVTTPSYSAVNSPVYSSAISRWKNYNEPMQQILKELEPYIEEYNYTT